MKRHTAVHLTQRDVLLAYAAAQSLPDGTPIFLDGDGDIAYPTTTEFPEELPHDCIYLCMADSGAFAMPHYNIYWDQHTDKWRVSGYGNAYDTRGEAVEFALNTCGADGEVLEDFAEHILRSARFAYLEA